MYIFSLALNLTTYDWSKQTAFVSWSRTSDWNSSKKQNIVGGVTIKIIYLKEFAVVSVQTLAVCIYFILF